LIGFGELRHEPPEGGAEPGGVKKAEQAAEGVVAGNAVFELEEAAQERLFAVANSAMCVAP